MSVHRPSKPHTRSGAVLAMVLVSLLVASLLGLALVQTVLIHHRQTRLLGRQQQCFWLAEAGVQRAIAGLAATADYSGETWEVSAETLGAERSAVVTIEVTRPADSAETRQIRVEARFPDEPTQRIASLRELVVFLPSESAVGDGEERE